MVFIAVVVVVVVVERLYPIKDIAEVSEQISHLLNCATENNRKRKLQYLFSHVTLG